MSYVLKSITIRTNNSEEGMKKIADLWQDVASGKLPILFDSDHIFQQGISPISQYSNYESDESGNYDLSIKGVTADFFQKMEKAVAAGNYKKYDVTGDDLASCAAAAWDSVWSDQKNGAIKRAFSKDYESTVPAEYTKDGKCHCYLYISIE